MTRKTGWPQEMFLMQDDCSKLSRWFASRIDARETIRRVFRKEDMTQKNILKMAADSGLELYGLGKDRAKFIHHLEAFAKLVADEKKESCAKLCEGLTNYRVGSVRADFASAIRATK